MRKFKELNIWTEGIVLVKMVYELCTYLPANEKFGLVSQMQRAAVSVPSNIAEACSRRSDVEFARYLEIALGSAFELETQLILVKELNLTAENDKIEASLIHIEKLQKMISSFKSKIRK